MATVFKSLFRRLKKTTPQHSKLFGDSDFCRVNEVVRLERHDLESFLDLAKAVDQPQSCKHGFLNAWNKLFPDPLLTSTEGCGED